MIAHIESEVRGRSFCGEPFLYWLLDAPPCQACQTVRRTKEAIREQAMAEIYVNRDVLCRPGDWPDVALEPTYWRAKSIELARSKYIHEDPCKTMPMALLRGGAAFHLFALGEELPTPDEIAAAGGAVPDADELRDTWLEISRRVNCAAARMTHTAA